MQYAFSLTPKVLGDVEITLSSARLNRFIVPPNADKNLALRMSIWNMRLCEAFYLPIQLTEVAFRNAVMIPVVRKYGSAWFEKKSFESFLPQRRKEELSRLVDRERDIRGPAFTANHVVAGLSFGFWHNLTHENYKNYLWANGLRNSFPNLPRTMELEDVYNIADRFRKFRNKIAHHYAIFDRSPVSEYQNMLKLLGLVCKDTEWLCKELNAVSRVINQRPKLLP